MGVLNNISGVSSFNEFLHSSVYKALSEKKMTDSIEVSEELVKSLIWSDNHAGGRKLVVTTASLKNVIKQYSNTGVICVVVDVDFTNPKLYDGATKSTENLLEDWVLKSSGLSLEREKHYKFFQSHEILINDNIVGGELKSDVLYTYSLPVLYKDEVCKEIDVLNVSVPDVEFKGVLYSRLEKAFKVPAYRASSVLIVGRMKGLTTKESFDIWKRLSESYGGLYDEVVFLTLGEEVS